MRFVATNKTKRPKDRPTNFLVDMPSRLVMSSQCIVENVERAYDISDRKMVVRCRENINQDFGVEHVYRKLLT